MAKQITLEMLEAMSPDQRKTLHQNALNLDTPAAKEVIDMLVKGDLVRRPAASVASAKPKKVKAAAAPKAKAKKAAPAKHGRQS